MAVRHGYGKIAGADALVFAYDTGDTRNSYKGEPTVNLANTDTARTLVKHDASSVMTFADAPEKGPGWKKVTITERSANNFRYAQFPYISNPGGTQRTYSVEYDAGSLTGYGWRVDGTAGYNTTAFTGTGRYQMTITPGATGVYALFLTNSSSATGINDTIYYRFYQVENNSHATQFTDGTRSSTQGLLDLTGNSTIDLTNAGFDSNAQIDFDGTTDSITPTGFKMSTTDATQEYTLEAIIKRGGGTTTGGIITQYRTASGAPDRFGFREIIDGRLSWWKGGNIAIGASAMPTGVYLHIVGTRADDGTVTVYQNGQVIATGTDARVFEDEELQIGTFHSGIAYFDGEIPVTKIYNRALSAAEVKNNYNNYKGRFNI